MGASDYMAIALALLAAGAVFEVLVILIGYVARSLLRLFEIGGR